MKKIISILLLGMLSFNVLAQERLLKKADEYFDNGNYVQAIKTYKKLTEKSGTSKVKKHCFLKIAESYYRMNNYEEAIDWYKNIVFSSHTDLNDIINFGDAYLKNKDFENARNVYKEGLALHGQNAVLKHKLDLCNLYEKRKSSDDYIEVIPVSNINTPYSEYAPAWLNEELVFTSSRKDEKNTKVDRRTNQAYSDFYNSIYDWDEKEWNTANRGPEALNKKYNEGTFTFDHIHSTAYFMRCNSRNKSCKIFQSTQDLFGNWTEPEPVPFMDKAYSYGHPSISNDGKTLYFVADLPNGYGGKDIWKISKLDEKMWGFPENAGPQINSSYDDLFPYIHGDSILFFSSDRNEGYGGLDFYVSIKKNNNFSEAVLLKAPVNSNADDFTLLLKENLNQGFMASNRENKQNSDDIYTINRFPIPIKVNGKIVDMNTNTGISDVAVIIKSKDYGTDTVMSSKDGSYEFLVSPYINYKLEFDKKGFIKEYQDLAVYNSDLIYSYNPELKNDYKLSKIERSVSLNGIVTNRLSSEAMPGEMLTISSSYGLTDTSYTDASGYYEFKNLKAGAPYTVKISKTGFFSESRSCDIPQNSDIVVFNKENGYDMNFELTEVQEKKEIVINNILYDFDKASLRPESMIELDKLASMIKETPGLIIQINSHTDSRGSNTYNDKLSNERAQSVVYYLQSKGVDADRLLHKGHGERRLLIPDARTESEHQMNRRTSFEIVSIAEDYYSNETSNNKYIIENSYVQNHSGYQNYGDGQNFSGNQDYIDNEFETNTISFRVQVLVSSRKLNPNEKFAHLLEIPNTSVYVTSNGSISKYEIGSRSSLKEIQELKRKIYNKGIKDCFITAYQGGRKISLKEARKMLGL